MSQQNCNSVRKREALREYPHHSLLSYGPIRVEMPNKPQSSQYLVYTPSVISLLAVLRVFDVKLSLTCFQAC